MNHPVFTRDMEDKLSLFFLRFATSTTKLLFGIGALVCFVITVFFSINLDAIEATLWGKAAMAYSVIGILLTWLAAQAHAYKNNRKKWLFFIFILWPISYWYLIHTQYFSNEPTHAPT